MSRIPDSGWMNRRLAFVSVVVVAACALFAAPGIPAARALGCGYERKPAAQTDTGVTIVEVGTCIWAYNPSTLVVSPGATVTWSNQTPYYQTATSDVTSTLAWDSGAIPPGGFYTHTFEVPGVFTYHSQFYDYMHGAIAVLARVRYMPLVAR